MSARRNKRSSVTKQAPLDLHEFCKMVPEHSPEDYQRLVADLKKTGKLIEAITTFEGKVLDGRGRQKAGPDAGIALRYAPFQGDRKAAFDFVLSKNLARRHLTIAQRKALALQIFKEDPSISTHAAAKKVGLSNKTAEKVRPEGTLGESQRRDTKGRKVGVRLAGRKTNGKAGAAITDLARSRSPVPPQRTPAEEARAMLEKGMLDASYNNKIHDAVTVEPQVEPQVEPLERSKSLVVPLATRLNDLLSAAWVVCSVEDGWPPLTSAKRKRRTRAINALSDLRIELVALATPNKIKPAIEPDEQRVEQ